MCVFAQLQKQDDSPCLLCEGTEILWKFHSGLHELIIIVYAATGNALAKVTSLQGTEEEETKRGKEKVSREGGPEDGKQFQCVELVRCTYRFNGVLVNFGFCLPKMMPIYWQNDIMQYLVLVMNNIIVQEEP